MLHGRVASAALKEAGDEEEDHYANGGHYQTANEASCTDAEGSEEKAADNGANDVDYHISQDAKAAAAHEQACQPAGNYANQ